MRFLAILCAVFVVLGTSNAQDTAKRTSKPYLDCLNHFADKLELYSSQLNAEADTIETSVKTYLDLCTQGRSTLLPLIRRQMSEYDAAKSKVCYRDATVQKGLTILQRLLVSTNSKVDSACQLSGILAPSK